MLRTLTLALLIAFLGASMIASTYMTLCAALDGDCKVIAAMGPKPIGKVARGLRE
jgi:hypothetical protein